MGRRFKSAILADHKVCSKCGKLVIDRQVNAKYCKECAEKNNQRLIRLSKAKAILRKMKKRGLRGH